MAWRFGTHRLDAERFELTQDGVTVRVEPQALAILLHLASNRHRMVPKEELAEVVWKGAPVSEASISSRIRSARAAVGDDGRRQEVIRTVHGRGFRFSAEITETLAARPHVADRIAQPTAPQSGRPSIAVLPFRALAIDEEY